MAGELGNCYALRVDDVREAAGFYERVLGYERRLESPSFIEMRTGALRLFITREEVAAPAFEMLVDDLEAAARRLCAQGFEREPRQEGVVLRDPFGYVYALIEARPEESARAKV